VTGYVITLNEEQNLPDCLRSLEWCDELLVVDSFSEDRTCAIAAEFGARVIQNEWPGFGRQKQFALSNVRTRWALNVDADERVSPELRRSICEATSGDNDAAGYVFRRTTFHLGGYFRQGSLYEKMLRLGLSDRSCWIGEDVHERLKIDGPVGWIDGELLHDRNRSLSRQLATLDKYSTAKARELYSDGVKPGAVMLLSHTMVSFVRSLILKRGFLAGVPGLIVALEQASYTFYKYAKCWEMQHAPRPKNGRVPERSE